MAFTILRGGRVLDISAGTLEAADVLIENDTIREIGAPGCAAPPQAVEVSAPPAAPPGSRQRPYPWSRQPC
jgi:guanine deaminase